MSGPEWETALRATLVPGAAEVGDIRDRVVPAFIDGEFVSPAGSAELPVLDPSSSEQLARLVDVSTDQLDDAVAAAAAAFASWRAVPADERGRILWRVAEGIEREAGTLALLESVNQGQPLGLAKRVSVGGAAAHFRYFAGWTTKLDGRVPAVSRTDAIAFTTREPIGVCALITPWNFPLMIAAWKLAPALATGNTVVLKSAEETPLTTLLLMRIMRDAGVPAGVVNFVPGAGEVGRALVAHPRVDKVSFTGSTPVGREIIAAAAPRLARVTVELGGKAPSIVCADADLERAASGNVASATLNSGQVCGALSRFYVARPVYDEFVDRVAARLRRIRLGAGIDPATDLGPLASFRHRASVDGIVQRAIDSGGEALVGGAAVEDERLASGAYVAPTLLVGLDNTAESMREEIFGPVMPIMPFDDLDEAISLANDSEYGLAASVWTRDVDAALVVSSRLQVGSVRINTVSGIDPAAPWGGTGASGWGREMGPDALDEFTETKAVWLPRDPTVASLAVEGRR